MVKVHIARKHGQGQDRLAAIKVEGGGVSQTLKLLGIEDPNELRVIRDPPTGATHQLISNVSIGLKPHLSNLQGNRELQEKVEKQEDANQSVVRESWPRISVLPNPLEFEVQRSEQGIQVDIWIRWIQGSRVGLLVVRVTGLLGIRIGIFT